MRSSPSNFVLAIGAALAASLALLSKTRPAVAEDNAAMNAERAARCATRLSIAMIGEAASSELLASTNPQGAVDTLIADDRFIERFSRFVNSQFNMTPGATPAEDASYYLAKYVLENKKPWTEMFLGKYEVAPSNPQQASSEAVVTEDPDGLGYFRSRVWMVRYAGNEPAGMRIVAAYRMMWNTLGLTLAATTNAPDADVSATGRESAQCRGCHKDAWYALDKVADVLGTRKGPMNNVQFDPPTGGPKTILGGVTVSNDKELVTALVGNEGFDVNVCRLAYKYLYGRGEYSCEGPAFDRCVAAFKKDKMITTAVATVAKDSSFCE
ncbi:MAG: hypothetical protein JST00_01185 [Deltaproteobacteria bacterium]|nr:hypothetical protein [Deltaproteobacteria bacterium]